MPDALDTLKKIIYDNIDQFVQDLNHNFAVVQNSPLYKGIPGKNALPGDTGLRGIRGSQFVFVNYSNFIVQFPNELLNASKITLAYLNNKLLNFSDKQKLLTALGLVELVNNDVIVLSNSMMISYNFDLDLFINTNIAFNEQINLISSIESQIQQYVQFYIAQNPTILSLKNILESYTTYAKNYPDTNNVNVTTVQTPSSVYVPYYPGLTSNTNGVLVNHKYLGFNDTEFGRDNNGTIVFGSIKKYIDLLEATVSLNDGETLTSDYAPGANNDPIAIFLQDTPNAGLLIGRKSNPNLRRFGSIYKNSLDELVIKSDAGPDSSSTSLDFSKLIISKTKMKYDKSVEFDDNLDVAKDLRVLGNFDTRFLRTNEFVALGLSNFVEIGFDHENSITRNISNLLQYSNYISRVFVTGQDGSLSKEYSLETIAMNPVEEAAFTQITSIPTSDKKIVTSNYLGFLMRKINNISSIIGGSSGTGGNFYTKAEFATNSIPGLYLQNYLVVGRRVVLSGEEATEGSPFGDNMFESNYDSNTVKIGNDLTSQTTLKGELWLTNFANKILVTNGTGKLSTSHSLETTSLLVGQEAAYAQITQVLTDNTKIVTSNYIGFLMRKFNNLNTSLGSDYYKKIHFTDGTLASLFISQYLEARGNIYLGGPDDENLLAINESLNKVKIGLIPSTTINVIGNVHLDNTPSAVLVTDANAKVLGTYSVCTTSISDTVPETYATVPVDTSAIENLIPVNVGTRSPNKFLSGAQNNWIINVINSIKTRLKNTFNKTESDARYLLKGSNLSDLNNISTAQMNLDVFGKQASDYRYLKLANNLADIPNGIIARTNLDVFSKQETLVHIGARLIFYVRITGYTGQIHTTNSSEDWFAYVTKKATGYYSIYFRERLANGTPGSIVVMSNHFVIGNSLDGGENLGSNGGSIDKVVGIRKCGICNISSNGSTPYVPSGQIEVTSADDTSRNDCEFEIFLYRFGI